MAVDLAAVGDSVVVDFGANFRPHLCTWFKLEDVPCRS